MEQNWYSYFRPKTFSDVVGQDTAKAALIKIALTPGIAVRSIFLKGSWGSGKTTLCRIFAAAMNDPDFSKNHDVTPENCADVYSKTSQLYMEFDASVAGNIDAIRSLTERLSYIPQGRRVVVFDEIHAASKQALNALLKIVEDGVPNTIFVFASTEDILPTIKSRSLCLEISTIPPALMSEHLRKIASLTDTSISDSSIDLICMKSAGHMRDALGLLQLYSMVGESGLSSSYSKLVEFFFSVAKKDAESAKSVLSQVLCYPVVDIRNSLYSFIKNCYISTPESKLYPFLKTNLVSKIYSYFFTPVSQSALKDEMGLQICFRDFIDKATR